MNTILANKTAVQTLAGHLVHKREMFGDELIEVLEQQKLVKPELDYTREETWPKM